MSEENVEVGDSEEVFAALNRRDWRAFSAELDAEVEYAPVEEDAAYRGPKAVTQYAKRWLEAGARSWWRWRKSRASGKRPWIHRVALRGGSKGDVTFDQRVSPSSRFRTGRSPWWRISPIAGAAGCRNRSRTTAWTRSSGPV
jgi:hypothetical protein